jgi:hypothetical protein
VRTRVACGGPAAVRRCVRALLLLLLLLLLRLPRAHAFDEPVHDLIDCRTQHCKQAAVTAAFRTSATAGVKRERGGGSGGGDRGGCARHGSDRLRSRGGRRGASSARARDRCRCSCRRSCRRRKHAGPDELSAEFEWRNDV